MNAADDDGTLNEETDHWLWDLEERYDLGQADDQVATHLAPVAADERLANVKRYRRNQDGDGAGLSAGEPTLAMGAVGGEFSEPRHIPPPPASPHRVNRWAIAAAVLVVIGLGGVILVARNHGSSPNVAIGAPTTTLPQVGPPGVSVVTVSPTGDTTATTGAPATPPPATVPGAIAASAGAPSVNFTPVGTTVFVRTTQPPTRVTNPPGTPGTTAPAPAPAPTVATTTPVTRPLPGSTTLPPATSPPTAPPTVPPSTLPFQG